MIKATFIGGSSEPGQDPQRHENSSDRKFCESFISSYLSWKRESLRAVSKGSKEVFVYAEESEQTAQTKTPSSLKEL